MKILTGQEIHEQASSPKVRAGELAQDEFGRIWIYLQASETLSFGNILKANLAVANADVDTAAAADTRRVTGTGDFPTTTIVDAADATKHGHQYRLFIDAGAAQNQGGVISKRVSNNAVDVYWETSDDGKIGTALTTSSDYLVYVFTRVAKTAAATDRVVAIAQMDITDEYWFWGLVFGHGWVLLDGDGNAPAAAAGAFGLIPTAVSGVAGGFTGSPASTEAGIVELACCFGHAIIDTDTTGDVLIPGLFNCMRTMPIAFPDIPPSLTYNYPKK